MTAKQLDSFTYWRISRAIGKWAEVLFACHDGYLDFEVANSLSSAPDVYCPCIRVKIIEKFDHIIVRPQSLEGFPVDYCILTNDENMLGHVDLGLSCGICTQECSRMPDHHHCTVWGIILGLGRRAARKCGSQWFYKLCENRQETLIKSLNGSTGAEISSAKKIVQDAILLETVGW